MSTPTPLTKLDRQAQASLLRVIASVISALEILLHVTRFGWNNLHSMIEIIVECLRVAAGQISVIGRPQQPTPVTKQVEVVRHVTRDLQQVQTEARHNAAETVRLVTRELQQVQTETRHDAAAVSDPLYENSEFLYNDMYEVVRPPLTSTRQLEPPVAIRQVEPPVASVRQMEPPVARVRHVRLPATDNRLPVAISRAAWSPVTTARRAIVAEPPVASTRQGPPVALEHGQVTTVNSVRCRRITSRSHIV